MPRDFVSDVIRDFGFGVATLISNFRDRRGLPVYFHWILLVGAMQNFWS